MKKILKRIKTGDRITISSSVHKLETFMVAGPVGARTDNGKLFILLLKYGEENVPAYTSISLDPYTGCWWMSRLGWLVEIPINGIIVNGKIIYEKVV